MDVSRSLQSFSELASWSCEGDLISALDHFDPFRCIFDAFLGHLGSNSVLSACALGSAWRLALHLGIKGDVVSSGGPYGNSKP